MKIKESLAGIKLPSPPAIAVRILEAVKKEETSFDELARIITADPALTSKILRVANSPMYAVPSKVDSIQRALTVIGCSALKNIALSFVIANEMRAQSEDGFDFDFFWKRSVTAAVSGELIASLVGMKSDDIFVSALLQDIGIVIMYLSNPGDYSNVLEEKKRSEKTIIDAEKAVFGVDHQKIGMKVLDHWGIPESISGPVGCHHKGMETNTGPATATEVLYLSDKLSSLYHGAHGSEKMVEIHKVFSQRFDVKEHQIRDLVDAVAENSVQIMSFFDVDPGNMRPFSQMLQEANEELGKVNLSYEQLVIELKQAKETAENLAAELKAANELLSELAFRDGLTGLYNHRFFQEQMEKEVSRAGRYQRDLALILFDLDHFKKVNDEYGHPVGDRVLKETATIVMDTIRKSDLPARYGGEEFAIVIPETDMKGVVILAERLRKRVADMRLDVDGYRLGVTISLGVTIWESGAEITDKATMISAADKALYQSKKTGRNKTSFASLSSVAQRTEPAIA
ncbi:MAG: GGDEF domain-containing protein [Desulfosarcina sp.]|jgi:diguanylate cyclase (GGDEF)-like protein